ncbi:MAG: LacI family transcriptional regulator [Clostridia bacterium]|nr:LacI family transcriptional regulator [Clostridia bacterium]NCC45160.1 LacI family transcriptional regulator [Clostridia bacterium]
MITIREIAEELGVSPTTVSNVLHGRAGKMSEQTRRKVEEALIRNHYVNDRKTKDGEQDQKLIAVYFCLGEKKRVLTDPFCGSILEGVDRELRKYDRALVCGTVATNDEFEDKLKGRNIEGGILLGCEPDNCATLTRKVKKPLVFVDSGYGEYDNIGILDEDGTYEIISFLIRQGHDKIAFFCDQKIPVASNSSRLKGYKKALDKFQIPYREDDYYYLPMDENQRHEVLRQFAKKAVREGYTAAFFVSDYLANEGISIFFSKNLRVPDDISVASFDDNIYAKLSRPMLTTVRQNPEEKGREAVKLLMKRIYGKEVLVRNINLPTELIVRDSVKNVAGK